MFVAEIKCLTFGCMLDHGIAPPIWIRDNIMVFNGTFNNMSVISSRLVLLVEETGVSGEIHRPFVSHRQTLLHIMLYQVHLSGIRSHNVCDYRH
jgi:hypothetical protein